MSWLFVCLFVVQVCVEIIMLIVVRSRIIAIQSVCEGNVHYVAEFSSVMHV